MAKAIVVHVFMGCRFWVVGSLCCFGLVCLFGLGLLGLGWLWFVLVVVVGVLCVVVFCLVVFWVVVVVWVVFWGLLVVVVDGVVFGWGVVVDGMKCYTPAALTHTMSALVCGLDVHKDSTYATILDFEGKIVNQSRMENEKVASYLSHYGVCKVAMESSTAVAPMYLSAEERRL
jgi:hypothetical protein